MRSFDDFLDLTGKNRTLKCSYHGDNEYVHLEGRILSEDSSELVVGVSLWPNEVHSHKYVKSRKSLDIWYDPFLGMRAGLQYTEFNVPKDIKEINVYDKGQKVK